MPDGHTIQADTHEELDKKITARNVNKMGSKPEIKQATFDPFTGDPL